MPRLLAVLSLLLVLFLPVATLGAQWQWSLTAGSASVSGHARAEDDPERPEVAPNHPMTLTLAVTRQRGAWRAGLQLARTRSDLGIRGIETAVVTRGTLRAWGTGVEIGRRIAGTAGAPELALLAGAVLERWTFPGTSGEARILASVRGAVEGTVPLRPRWQAIIRGEAALGGSLFRESDLPLGYTTHPGRRRGIRLGIGWTP